MTTRQRIIQSTVRATLSIGGHAAAIAVIIAQGSQSPGFESPKWLPPMVALVITWYFATKETPNDAKKKPPLWQVTVRSLVRAFHAVAGGIALFWLLLIKHYPVPDWWIAIYLSILTFYFIEMRDPPEAEEEEERIETEKKTREEVQKRVKGMDDKAEEAEEKSKENGGGAKETKKEPGRQGT